MRFKSSDTPRLLGSIAFPGRCAHCGKPMARGTAAYYQGATMARKARLWHVECYEQAAAAADAGDNPDSSGAAVPGQGDQGGSDATSQGRGQGQPVQDRQQDDGVTPGGSVPQGAGQDSDSQGQPGQGDSDSQQADDGQGDGAMSQSNTPPKAHEQVCPILFDEAKMQRHLHREDLYEILRDGFGGYNLSALSKAQLAQRIQQNADMTREQEQAGDDSYSASRNAKNLLRTDDVLRRVLKVTARTPAEDSNATQRAQQQAQQAMDNALKARQQAVEQAEARERAEQAMRDALAEAEAAKKAAQDAVGRVVQIKTPDGATVSVDGRHHTFPKLAALVLAGVPVMIVGPAGGGKTEACRSLAKDLDRTFVPLSLGPQTTQASLFGYTDATGNYVRTPFREAFENGGLILLDEFDRCNERVSVTLNAAIAQRYCAFPDGTIEAHAECIIVAAANTTGHGADRQYVSARQQDAATLDRFAVLDWQYDERFEEALTLAQGLDRDLALAWLRTVRKVRSRVAELALRYLVSPRAAIQGAKLMATGADLALATDTILFRGWNAEDRAKVERSL